MPIVKFIRFVTKGIVVISPLIARTRKSLTVSPKGKNMKINRTSLKGVGLLLLGLTAIGGRSLAVDIDSLNLVAFTESSSADNPGTAVASPFKDEPISTPAK